MDIWLSQGFTCHLNGDSLTVQMYILCSRLNIQFINTGNITMKKFSITSSVTVILQLFQWMSQAMPNKWLNSFNAKQTAQFFHLWISRRGRMTAEIISRSISIKIMWPSWDSSLPCSWICSQIHNQLHYGAC